MRVLISGAGIAGPTLAWWLARYGFDPTIVERAPQLRSGGYIIDFWGLGFDVAERMELLPEIREQGYRIRELQAVNRQGARVAGFPVEAFDRVTHGRYVSLPRSELSAAIYRRILGRVEIMFGDSIAGIEQNSDGVRVRFERAEARDFELVIGADGLHSQVRALVFGPEARFEKYLGSKAAAFQAEGYSPRDELVYVLYSEVGQQTARFAMRDNRTMFLFTFADPDPKIPESIDGRRALLRARFGSSGWECPRILDALDAAPELYFDRVSQIRMPAESPMWSRGRVALLGDAAFCPSLLAGQGSALAMASAYILAGELHQAGGDYARAFANYERIFAPFIRGKQKAAARFAGAFAPRNSLSLFLRNQIINLLTVPWIADLAFARDFRDSLPLPAYR